MARSNITNAKKDIMSDDGAVILSIIHGEQTRLSMVVGWLESLSGCEITCKIIEGDNVQDSGELPLTFNDNPKITELAIVDTDPMDNVFEVTIPEDLIEDWKTYPIVDTPIFGFIGLEIKDNGIGALRQIWKPLRGMVSIRFSPTEVT